MTNFAATPSPIELELLDRYVTGAATPDERAHVDAWIAEDVSRTTVLQTLRELPVRRDVDIRPLDVTGEWRALHAKIERAAASNGAGPFPRRLTRRGKKTWSLVSGARGLALTGIGMALCLVVASHVVMRGHAW